MGVNREFLKSSYGEVFKFCEDGYYARGSFFPNDGSNLFPVEMNLMGINKILRRTRAYLLGVRFIAYQKRDSVPIENFYIYD